MILYFYLVPIFLSFLLYLFFFLYPHLIFQRLRPIFVLLHLSSSFHGKLLFLPFKVMVKSPPSTSIFFFFFLSWSNHLSTTSTNLHHKNHKNQNPLAPQESKPTSMDSVDPQASISAASTNPQASKPIPVDSQALISATNIDSQASRPISVDP